MLINRPANLSLVPCVTASFAALPMEAQHGSNQLPENSAWIRRCENPDDPKRNNLDPPPFTLPINWTCPRLLSPVPVYCLQLTGPVPVYCLLSPFTVSPFTVLRSNRSLCHAKVLKSKGKDREHDQSCVQIHPQSPTRLN